MSDNNKLYNMRSYSEWKCSFETAESGVVLKISKLISLFDIKSSVPTQIFTRFIVTFS